MEKKAKAEAKRLRRIKRKQEGIDASNQPEMSDDEQQTSDDEQQTSDVGSETLDESD